MAVQHFTVAFLVLFCLIEASYGVTFTSLKDHKTLVVTTNAKPGQVFKAGKDNLTVSWSFDKKFAAGTDLTYKTVKVKLCYAPISQMDRGWRKTVDDLSKDKTCQFKIVAKPYTSSGNNFTWAVEKDIPTATYFIRAYAFNSDDDQVAYGQTTNDPKTNNFQVEGITGIHASLYIASASFSAFSIVSLLGFFYVDKRNAKRK